MATPLRERKKARVREDLSDAAIRLFEARGFDAVTVDEIADAAMVSPRTFFRYFGSKEAVLYADLDDALVVLEFAIASEPPEAAPLDVIRAAVVAASRHTEGHRDDQLRRSRLARTGPSIAAYSETVIRPRWERVMVAALAERLGVDPDADVRPRLFAGVAMTVMTAVGTVWIANDGRIDVDAVLNAAFDELSGLRPPGRRG